MFDCMTYGNWPHLTRRLDNPLCHRIANGRRCKSQSRIATDPWNRLGWPVINPQMPRYLKKKNKKKRKSH
jgi:hypothetical protein